VTTIEGADSDGEDDVVRLFVGLQNEVFERMASDAHAARADLLGRGNSGLPDSGGGPIDGKNVAGTEPGGDRSCRAPEPHPISRTRELGWSP